MLEVMTLGSVLVLLASLAGLSYLERERLMALFRKPGRARDRIPEPYLSALSASINEENQVLVEMSRHGDIATRFSHQLRRLREAVERQKQVLDELRELDR